VLVLILIVSYLYRHCQQVHSTSRYCSFARNLVDKHLNEAFIDVTGQNLKYLKYVGVAKTLHPKSALICFVITKVIRSTPNLFKMLTK
jgi:hypothetical protein